MALSIDSYVNHRMEPLGQWKPAPILQKEEKPQHIFCTIIPPHMEKQISENPNHMNRKSIQRHLSRPCRFRDYRHMALDPELLSAQKMEAIKPATKRVYDLNHSEELRSGKLISDPESSSDIVVVEAHTGAAKANQLFAEVFKRDSIDNRHMDINSHVHFGKKYDNAFWNGKEMVYGDGDGKIFNRFTIAVDVIGHELAHGVTQFTANLNYYAQAGALNESVSDVFGTILKQWIEKDSNVEPDWLIGKGLLVNQEEALRSMKAPGTAYNNSDIGKDPQPAHMADYVYTYEDNGGVHINSGIPNHAFYLMSTKLDEKVDNKFCETTGKIWYETLSLIPKSPTFSKFAYYNIKAAKTLYGKGSAQEQAVRFGWESVGVRARRLF